MYSGRQGPLGQGFGQRALNDVELKPELATRSIGHVFDRGVGRGGQRERDTGTGRSTGQQHIPIRPEGTVQACWRDDQRHRLPSPEQLDREVALADVQQPPGLETNRFEGLAVAPEPPLALRATVQVVENHARQPLCREPSVVLDVAWFDHDVRPLNPFQPSLRLRVS